MPDDDKIISLSVERSGIHSRVNAEWYVATIQTIHGWISYPCFRNHSHSAPVVHRHLPLTAPEEEILVAHASVMELARAGKITPGIKQ